MKALLRVHRSIDLLKKNMGEGLIGTFSFGLVFTVASLPAFFVVGAGVYLGKGMLTLALIIVAVAYLLVLSVFQSALLGIFQSALYQFARFGTVPRVLRQISCGTLLREGLRLNDPNLLHQLNDFK